MILNRHIDVVEKVADVLEVSIDYLICKTKTLLDKEAVEGLEDIFKLAADKIIMYTT